MFQKVYWISRHDLSFGQMSAIKALHGEDAEVIKDSATLVGLDGLVQYVQSHLDGFVYAVAPFTQTIAAALAGCEFGMFENHPAKRVDGSFGLAAVYHIRNGQITKVWSNPDPMADEGEVLAPIAR